ncbi:MAG: D-tyrosyl-tRNA(Tyr) deacylase [Methylibium sp.]|uniref:D-aminoacyl-tRNA deacylase n=1 Tax=Methylibium sp. TaxID=2067992 RepID=UPI0017BB66C1|nr:D-aminoacyl-tRNA deacylase [Methylibium sp.]MBA2722460.1 D-tyrosyl-tRNA(Tyr) deacylase [Methylibium sp.]MBA3588481.1 D-tyrosyl-tRNA(Tyr) deacylase [Methylibium sp.]
MIALLQRVREAKVEVDGGVVGAIGPGLLVLVCAEIGDGDAQAERLVDKCLKLRIFADDAGKMNRSVQQLRGPGGEPTGGLLIVSQFTLAADTRAGNRPSFTRAAPAALGRRLYDHVVACARERHPLVEAGVFGADMQVHLVNDGPVTVPLVIANEEVRP